LLQVVVDYYLCLPEAAHLLVLHSSILIKDANCAQLCAGGVVHPIHDEDATPRELCWTEQQLSIHKMMMTMSAGWRSTSKMKMVVLGSIEKDDGLGRGLLSGGTKTILLSSLSLSLR
jgi:hypothetical protein